jgi:hypothetical protein
MVLREFLKKYKREPADVLKQSDYTEAQIAEWEVIYYPDGLLYILSKELNEEISMILYQLFQIENPVNIRKVSSDYALRTAIENEAAYIFIPKAYRKAQSKLLTDIAIKKGIFELNLGPLAKYNFVGEKIYEVFLAGLPKGEEFQRIENQLNNYYVLIHDDAGSLLAIENRG